MMGCDSASTAASSSLFNKEIEGDIMVVIVMQYRKKL
jgi:hypothetical protein